MYREIAIWEWKAFAFQGLAHWRSYENDEITAFHMKSIIIYTRRSYVFTLQNIAEARKNYGVFPN